MKSFMEAIKVIAINCERWYNLSNVFEIGKNVNLLLRTSLQE